MVGQTPTYFVPCVARAALPPSRVRARTGWCRLIGVKSRHRVCRGRGEGLGGSASWRRCPTTKRCSRMCGRCTASNTHAYFTRQSLPGCSAGTSCLASEAPQSLTFAHLTCLYGREQPLWMLLRQLQKAQGCTVRCSLTLLPCPHRVRIHIQGLCKDRLRQVHRLAQLLDASRRVVRSCRCRRLASSH